MKDKSHTPYIFVLCGIPCSGKSTFTKNYLKSCTVISRDEIRERMSSNYKHTKQNEERVTKEFDIKFNAAVALGSNIILDNTHCKEKYLQEWIKRKPVYYNLIVLFFDIYLFHAYLRNIGRWLKTGKWIPFKIIRDMKKSYDKINQKSYDMVY